VESSADNLTNQTARDNTDNAQIQSSKESSSKIFREQNKVQGLLQELSISAKENLKKKMIVKKLPNIYLLSVKILRRNNVNMAESQYRQELQDAITICGEIHLNSKKKLEKILSQFNSMSK
ncbi:14588_t:CDS:2, partial [Funneliformis caledonium]